MGKILVLAEKPSVGREIARVLGCRQQGDGCLMGPRYIVTWALGHLVTLADPEHYDKKYEKWELETLPMLPKTMELVVMKETGRQYRAVQALLKRGDVDSLVIATDAGREGELVARWILRKAGFRKPIQRLWISSQTDKAIREGFAHLRPGKEFENLYHSAQCRAEADWLVGLNVTRALTCKYNAQLSAGRVQTPTLAMIVAREQEIRRFVPVPYYTVSAKAGQFTLTRKDKTGSPRISDRAAAEAIAAKASVPQARLTEVRKTLKRKSPPQLYDLTELQRDCNKRYGFTAKQTLNHMQRLYEVHKLLTYPRTDSRYLPTDVVPTLRERLKSIAIGSYAPFANAIIRGGIHAKKHFVDNTKVSDHHAIIPTEQYVDLSPLSNEERRVYDLVVKRFLAVLMADFEYEETAVRADLGGEVFTAKGKIVKQDGWMAVYQHYEDEEDASEERDQRLPALRQGEMLAIQKVELGSGKTTPPPRYTEATLLGAMEHPGKFVQDAAQRAALEQAAGIGTPATRADIIEKLFSANYVERRGKEIVPLSKGMQLVELVPPELKSPALTAKWEMRLDAISRGKESDRAFCEEMRAYAKKLVGNVIAADGAYRHDNLTKNQCPECGKFMLEINGKRGKMLVCQDRDCGFRQSLTFLSNARCPQCHKKLTIYGEGEKRTYSCVCGFRERSESFQKKLAEQRGTSSKRDVSAYLQKQREEEPTVNLFAEALAKAMNQGKETK